MRARRLVAALTVVAVLAPPAPATSDDGAQAPESFEIPPQSLSAALVNLAAQADISIGLTGVTLTNRTSGRVSGATTVEEALHALLDGSDLAFERVAAGAWRIFAPPKATPDRIQAAAAQPTVPLTLPPIEEITVTAAKRPLALQSTSLSIAAVTGGTFADYGVQSTHDMVSFVAGLSTTNQGPGRNKFVMRGLSDGPFVGTMQSTVGVYIDETRVVFNAPAPNLPLLDIDRVEVIRGPQGTLYGGGAIGGLIRIITRQPVLDQFEARSAVEISVAGAAAPSHAADAVVNAPLIDDKLALRALVYARRDGGYIDNAARGATRINRADTAGTRVGAKLRLSPDWSLGTSIMYQSTRVRDSQYYDMRLTPFTRATLLPEPGATAFLGVSATLDGDFGRTGIVSTTAWLRHEAKVAFDASLALPALIRMPSEPALFEQENLYHALNHETRVVSDGGGDWKWVAGVFASYRYDTSRAEMTRVEQAPPDVFYAKNRRDTGTELAGFGEVQYKLTPRLTAGAGLRVYHGALSVTADNSGLIDDGPPVVLGRNSKTGVTPKAEFSFQASPDHFLYAQAAQGFRLGGVNVASRVTTPAAPGRRPITVSNFASDRLWNFEIGSKSAFLDHRLNLNATVFYALWNGMQADLVRSNGLSFTTNLGDARNKGFELEATLVPDDRWRFIAAASWNDPTVPTADTAGAVTTRLPGAPRFAGTLAAQYQAPLGGGVTGFVNLKYDLVGKSALAIGSLAMDRVPAYHAVNLRIGLRDAHWRLAAYVGNLADEQSSTSGFGNPFALEHIPQAIPLSPRVFGVSLGWSR